MNDDERPLLSEPGAGTPSFLRDALLAAREDGPGAADSARLAARLPVAPLPPPPVAAPPSVLSGALIGAALGALVAGAGLVWDLHRAPPPPARPAPTVVAPPPASALPTAPAARDHVDVPRPAPHAAIASPSGASPPAPLATAVVDSPAPPAAAPPATGAGPIGAGPIARASLQDEVDLITRARDRVRGNPAEALAITQEHARQFPGGTLAQEREVLAIEALHRLGRTGEARARRDRFIEVYPGFAHRSRFAVLFGD